MEAMPAKAARRVDEEVDSAGKAGFLEKRLGRSGAREPWRGKKAGL
jgi:hypothetical protein